MLNEQVFFVLIQFFVLLFSLSVHESAHAWSADMLGDSTARYLGRVSLNPIVHADLFGTIIFPLIGMLSGVMFGWAKPVPVNVGRLRNPVRDHMLVAAAGPASNLALAAGFFLFMMALKLSSPQGADLVREVTVGQAGPDAFWTPLAHVAYYGIVINLILAVFNLIPVAPLDGAAVLAGLLPRSAAVVLEQLQSYGLFILVALLVAGVPSKLYNPVLEAVLSYLVF